jgi:HK97 family phage major capsid protein
MNEAELRSFLEKQDGELKQLLSRGESQIKVCEARLMALEQHVASGSTGGGGFSGSAESIGDQIIHSEGFQRVVKGERSSGQIAFKSLTPQELKIVSGTWSSPPDYRPVVAFPPQPSLPVRALMPAIPTISNLVEFPLETSFTNNAGYQVNESDVKGQSDASYNLQQQSIVTLAHWLAASRQLMDDSTAFSAYVNARLLYKLEQVIEQEILFGNGAAGHLKGIWPQALPAGESQTGLADSVGASIGQLSGLGVTPDSVVVNPMDWWTARLVKASTAGTYLYGDPLQAERPTLWGLNLSLAVSMPQGSYLVGNFRNGAAVYDRQQNTLEISREHSDFFIRNMLAILVETRLAVVVFVPQNFVRGSIGPGS